MFNIHEDSFILKMFLKLGPQWKRMASYLTNKTGCQVKNRFHSFIKKNLLVNNF